jgi:hypothetical protein
MSLAEVEPDTAARAGERDLVLLLERLERDDVFRARLGVRERSRILVVIARFSSLGRAPRTPEDFANLLAPILAQSPAEQESLLAICRSTLELVQPEPLPPSSLTPAPAPLSRWHRLRLWLRDRPMLFWAGLMLAALVPTVIVASLYDTAVCGERCTPPVSRPVPDLPRPQPLPSDPWPLGPIDKTEREVLDRVIALRDPDGVLTLRRLATRMASTSAAGLQADAYLVRLVDYAAFAPDVLLPAWDVDVLARIAYAVHRIESREPGQGVAAIVGAASALVGLAPEAGKDLRDVLQGLRARYIPGSAAQPAADQLYLAALTDCRTRYPGSGGLSVCNDVAAKAAALWGFDAAVPQAAGPWRDEIPRAGGATYAPAWVPWAAGALPILLAAAWFGWRLGDHRRLWREALRRERPALHPLHHPAIARSLVPFHLPEERVRRTAQALSRRLPLPVRRLDVARTIDRTARSGGGVDVVWGSVRPAAEYLVLVEIASGADHQGQRFQRLVDQLRAMDVSLVRYHYLASPQRCFEDWESDGRDLAELAEEFPDHRLIILGEGGGLLDPVSLEPEPWASALATWERRALLTPVPADRWGAEELVLARSLGLAIGRSTPDGILALPELLRLDERDRTPVQLTQEQRLRNLALETPSTRLRPLLDQPELWQESAPPTDEHWPALRLGLLEALGADGYQWLAACALYPAVSWDLTVYLGLTLRNEARVSLYSEQRLAVLTGLPWFRDGRMPFWLRERLTKDLPASQRQAAASALRTLLGGKTPGPREQARIDAAPSTGPMAARPYGDSFFVDALVAHSQGRAGPLMLRRLTRFPPFGWGAAETSMATAAVLYGIAAWYLAPRPEHGALVAGAWLPLVLLGLALPAAGWLLHRLLREPRRAEPAAPAAGPLPEPAPAARPSVERRSYVGPPWHHDVCMSWADEDRRHDWAAMLASRFQARLGETLGDTPSVFSGLGEEMRIADGREAARHSAVMMVVMTPEWLASRDRIAALETWLAEGGSPDRVVVAEMAPTSDPWPETLRAAYRASLYEPGMADEAGLGMAAYLGGSIEERLDTRMAPLCEVLRQYLERLRAATPAGSPEETVVPEASQSAAQRPARESVLRKLSPLSKRPHKK